MNKIYSKILIVEDDEKWQEIIKRCDFLKNLPRESIICIKNDEEAEEQLNKYKIDVAITDFAFNENKIKTSYLWRNLARLLQANQIPTIVVSGYIDNIDLMTEMINEYGVVGVYHKGKIDLYKLSKHIEKIIHGRMNFFYIGNEIETSDDSKETGKINILHLSDLHCGPDSCFCGDDKSPSFDPVNFSQTIIDDIDKQNLSIDALVISGDFSSTSQNKEFDIALDFIDELKTKLILSENEIVVVPGNHDINWDEKDGNRRSQYQRFYRQLYGKKTIDSERLFHVASVKDKNLVIAGFDSCSIERPEYAGIGYIGHDQRKKIFNQINDITNGDKDYVKIAVLHHHLLPVESLKKIPGDGENFSLVMDASSLLQELYRENFSLILHGHQHQPLCADISLYGIDTGRNSRMAVIGAGSAGAKKKYQGNIGRNHYNIIEVKTNEQDMEVCVIGRQSSSHSEIEFERYKEVNFNLGSGLGKLK